MPGVDDAVIIPVYNEVNSIDAVLNTVRGYYKGELIVVDDGSDDGTQMKLAERDDLLIVRHDTNLGYGKSLIDGFAFAMFAGLERVLTMDCDGQHEPAHIPEFFDAMDRGEADIVSGSRYLPESRETGVAPSDRREVNARVTDVINEVTGWGITDAFCGFKGYSLSAVLSLGLSEPGYGMPMEMWAKAFRAGHTVMEIPVERIYCDHGRSFGESLDDPDRRLEYYMDVWTRALGGTG